MFTFYIEFMTRIQRSSLGRAYTLSAPDKASVNTRLVKDIGVVKMIGLLRLVPQPLKQLNLTGILEKG